MVLDIKKYHMALKVFYYCGWILMLKKKNAAHNPKIDQF